MTRTVEPQYEACFAAAPVTLGPMASEVYRRDPKRLGFVLARYKFVAKMLAGFERVAEVGCGDGFGAAVVRAEVKRLDLYDIDAAWAPHVPDMRIWNVCAGGPPGGEHYDAIYALDLLEHLTPEQEAVALANIAHSLADDADGVFIAGCPSLESQHYASAQSRAGHVNCKDGYTFAHDLRRHFRNVFVFSMSDEVVHTGFAPLAHYRFGLCVGPR